MDFKGCVVQTSSHNLASLIVFIALVDSSQDERVRTKSALGGGLIGSAVRVGCGITDMTREFTGNHRRGSIAIVAGTDGAGSRGAGDFRVSSAITVDYAIVWKLLKGD